MLEKKSKWVYLAKIHWKSIYKDGSKSNASSLIPHNFLVVYDSVLKIGTDIHFNIHLHTEKICIDTFTTCFVYDVTLQV